METKYPSLSDNDWLTLLNNLDASIAVFEKNQAPLTASELRMKSLLAALRSELRDRHRRRLPDSQSPFEL